MGPAFSALYAENLTLSNDTTTTATGNATTTTSTTTAAAGDNGNADGTGNYGDAASAAVDGSSEPKRKLSKYAAKQLPKAKSKAQAQHKVIRGLYPALSCELGEILIINAGETSFLFREDSI